MTEPSEEQLVLTAIARLRAGIMAIACGLIAGAGLMVATAWLVIRGGENIGQHLSLLGNFLPGYRVTWAGSLVGLAYGFLLGGAVGWFLVWVYNLIVDVKYGHRRIH
jgi:hypothetical protein